MDFNSKKFIENIEPYNTKDREITDESGVVNVIRHFTNRDSIDEVDFDSFQFDDVLTAFLDMERIAIDDGDDDEIFIADPHNPHIQFRRIDEALYSLAISKDKSYETKMDEEFFI